MCRGQARPGGQSRRRKSVSRGGGEPCAAPLAPRVAAWEGPGVQGSDWATGGSPLGGGARKGFRPFGGWGVRVRICSLVGLVAAVRWPWGHRDGRGSGRLSCRAGAPGGGGGLLERMTPVLWSPVPPCRAPGGVGAAGPLQLLMASLCEARWPDPSRWWDGGGRVARDLRGRWSSSLKGPEGWEASDARSFFDFVFFPKGSQI